MLLLATPARADVSSWLFVGGGPTLVSEAGGPERSAGTLTLGTGMGTPPSRTIVLGGMGHTETLFGEGTDLSLALRAATHGFVNGDFGAALDAGGYQRWWGVGSNGLRGSLFLGAPWGLTLGATATFGTDDSRSFAATVGIDLARLTVYRRTGSSWWRNPFPAHRPEDAGR